MTVKAEVGYAVTCGKFLWLKWLRGVSATLPIEHDQPRRGRRRAHLAEQRDELSPVIARMIDRVAKHLAERVPVLPAGTRLHPHRLVQAPVGEPREERRALGFDSL